MNYFTKEWYRTMQLSGLHFGVGKSKKAEVYFEDYFNKLYANRLNEYLTREMEYAQMSYLPPLEDYPYPDSDEFMDFLASDYGRDEKVLVVPFGDEPYDFSAGDDEDLSEVMQGTFDFDKEAYEERFREDFERRLRWYGENIPPEIRSEIADLRVYALGKVSSRAYKLIKEFSAANFIKADIVVDEYERYLKQKSGIRKKYRKNLDFNDCIITEVSSESGKLILTFDNYKSLTDVEKLVLMKPEITVQEIKLTGSTWLFEEIYLNNGRHEIKVLLKDNNDKLAYFAVTFSTMLMVHAERDWEEFE